MSRNPETSSGRLFTDLIQEASMRYGNWSPNQQMKVGDYGKLNRETAEFEKDGSIYDEDFMPELKIKENHDVEEQQPEDEFIVVSREGKTQGFDADFTAAYPGIASSHIKGRWSFGRGRGAVVVLHKPVEKMIKDRSMLLPKLTDTLKDRALVTSVFECGMFALLLTQKAEQLSDAAVGLNLLEKVGIGLNGTWNHYTSSGVWRCGGEEGKSIFYPLYSLRQPKVQKPRWKRLLGLRGSPEVQYEDEDDFEAYQPPWNVLDDDGNEIPTSDGEDEDEGEDREDDAHELN
ncbi:hypothetical protein EWM64_g4456 [Hericium alpestre]|uniref:Uncharacterized protein n=1 Tax=Hericium alpestre TaxID=135208 RepID=A0A4Y9ZZR0_9AGAM|nr:hypothetical protein EWM64_g4456 [Hericium alpestre]